MRGGRPTHRLLICAGGVVAACAAPASAQVGPLGKGHQWFLRNGLQLQGMVNVGDPFHLGTYQGLNYTAVNWLWDSNVAAHGPAPGSVPWARWVRPPTAGDPDGELPPVGGEGAYAGNLIALSMGDEPELNNPAIRDQYVNWFNAVAPSFPSQLLYMNNYGGQVTDGPLADFIARARPDMISFDTYPYRTAAPNNPTPTQPIGGSPKNLYGDLRRYRQHAYDNNIPLGVYRQTYHSISEGVRDPSESELRLMTFGALAFNAKYLTDFTYNTGASAFFNNAAGGDNSPNALYAAAQQINAEARNLGPALVRLKPVADAVAGSYTTSVMFVRGRHDAGALNDLPIGFIGDAGDANATYSEWTFNQNDPYLSGGFPNGATNLGTKNNGLPGDVIVSWFRPLDEWFDGDDFANERYLMVTNGLADMTATAAETRQTVTFDFNNAAATQVLQKLDRASGQVVDVPLPLVDGKRRLTFTLDGGTGDLFKFKTGAPFVGTMPADAIWTNGAGGTFTAAANWDTATPPPASHFVHFGGTTAGSGPAYAVGFAANANATGVFVHRDAVTWNLAGRAFNVAGFNGVDSFVVGQKAGEVASLTINNGAVNVAAHGNFSASVGKAAGAMGTLTLASGATFTSAANLIVGKLGAGTVNVNAGATATLTNVYLGGSSTAAGGVGVMNVSGGTTTVSGTLRLWNSGAAAPGGSRLNLTGGTLSVGALETNNNPARLNWTAGNLNLTASNVTIGSGGPFGTSLHLAAGKNLSVAQQTTINSGSTLAIAGGNFSAANVLNVGVLNHTAGTLSVIGTFTNAGAATIGGTQSWSAGATFANAGGSAAFQTDAGGASLARNLNLSATAGTVTLHASQHLAALATSGAGVVTLAANGARVIVTSAVTTTGASRVDLKDNKLIVKNGVLGTWNGAVYNGITGLIDAGRGSGAWTGGGLVTSMTDATGNSALTTLAVATAGDVGRTSFAGDSVDAADVLVMYTYGGDANLDGKIDIDDYGRIDANAASSGVVFGYSNGDFNYDGKINIDDYGIIDGNIGRQGPPLAGSAPDGIAAIPEPHVFILSMATLLARRRRRR